MYELTIEVTHDDINHGKRDDCQQCPIAQALLRYFGPNYDVSVGREEVLVWSIFDLEREELYFSTSDDAEDFIRAFDNGAVPSPQSFTFTLWQ